MGHRANYVIVEPGGYALYYSHWGALTVPEDLFWGPDHAARFIRHQERRQPNEWLDDIFAEGGALLDTECKRLILFGGDALSCEIPVRRLYLELLATVWQGWEVSWAHEGLADFADHLRLDRACVLSDPGGYGPEGPPNPATEFPPETICSLQRSGDPPALYPLASLVEQVFQRGPSLVEDLAALPAAEWLELDMSSIEGPMGGLHIDPEARSLEGWLAAPAADIERRMAAWWPGWAFTWHRDRYESQRDLTDSRLTFAEAGHGVLTERLSAILLRQCDGSPMEAMFDLIGRLEDRGTSVEVNPQALAHETLELPSDQRRRVFEAALAGLREAS